MDLPAWAYIVWTIIGVAGFISFMYFSYFTDKAEKENRL